MTHFSIVLLIIALACDLMALSGKRTHSQMQKTGHIFGFLGAFFCISTFLTGWGAGHIYSWDDPGVVYHRYFAIGLCTIVAITLLFRWCYYRDKPKIIVIILSILSVTVLCWTVEWGALLSHGSTPFQSAGFANLSGGKKKRLSFQTKVSPKHVEDLLKGRLDFEDVAPIFEKYKCKQCHAELVDNGTQFLNEWVPRDSKGEPLPLDQVPLYTRVVLANDMPPGRGIEDSERLEILLWLLNKAP